MPRSFKKESSAWLWIPSLYFVQGLPYVAVMTISVVMFKRLGVSNSDIAFYTSWLYLPWVIKPLWSPIVELFSRRRVWILAMQLLIGAAFASVALSLQVNVFFKLSLIFFWLLAFNSATHDIAADGFYILALDSHRQAWFVGVRSTFYRLSMIVGQGLLVMLAGYIESSTGLAKIDMEVSSSISNGDGLIRGFSKPEFNFSTVEPRERPEILILPSAKIAISAKKIQKELFSKILTDVKAFNGLGNLDSETKKHIKAGMFWDRAKEPLEAFLRKHFGTDAKKTLSANTGNCSLAFICLSAPPKEGKLVVNVDFIGGDKSIRLIEGARSEFTADNWNKPRALLFQIDPNLSKESSAKFAIRSGNIRLAWTVVFIALSILFLIFFIYHFIFLPSPESDISVSSTGVKDVLFGFIKPFVSFFRKENIFVVLLFLLLYRLGESQLVKLASPFLLDSIEAGGLGLSTGALGFAYGTVGVFLLTAGGIIGGIVASKYGLKKCLLAMALAINLPNLVYVYMAYYQPGNLALITTLVGIEQLGYGFGFAGYMLFMVYYAENSEYKTSHYAMMTGLMALGMMIPGMWSGWLQEIIGYENFFIWVCISTIPGFVVLRFLKVKPDFGKKK